MKEKGMSKGEFKSVADANGGFENMINWDEKEGYMHWNGSSHCCYCSSGYVRRTF